MEALPQTFAMAPAKLEALPQTFAMAPANVEALPQTFAMAPAKLEALPQTFAMALPISGEIPDKLIRNYRLIGLKHLKYYFDCVYFGVRRNAMTTVKQN